MTGKERPLSALSPISPYIWKPRVILVGTDLVPFKASHIMLMPWFSTVFPTPILNFRVKLTGISSSGLLWQQLQRGVAEGKNWCTWGWRFCLDLSPRAPHANYKLSKASIKFLQPFWQSLLIDYLKEFMSCHQFS